MSSDPDGRGRDSFKSVEIKGHFKALKMFKGGHNMINSTKNKLLLSHMDQPQ